ncbi:hypothetical protein Taro_039797 [Colocasia esculenta]|uniref:Uncharacterized protein n=1 Tax=Colocasia esculenta TaxID=4460 RepID=A0A843WGT7_COLES|nr:hypothetical protein [Colocasia esculenta]
MSQEIRNERIITCRQPAQSCRQAHAFQNSRFLDCVDLSTDPLLLSTYTHRARKPELCLLLAVDSPFLAVDSTPIESILRYSDVTVPITQGASSATSASSSVAETPSWGRGTGRPGPSRGATERRLEPGHKWNVRVIGGYRMWYCWDQTPQTDKEMLQHMTAMHKGWRGMLKSKHYKGKTFEDVVASIPLGVDPSDWRTMCQKWNSREEQDIAKCNKQNRTHQNMTYRRGRTSIYQLKDDFVKTHQREPDRMEERMTQMTTLSLQSDDAAPVSAEDALAVMGRDRPDRVRCAGKAETLRTWYGRGESSSGSYHTQLQDQNKKMEELCAERSRDRQELEELLQRGARIARS